MEFLEDVEERDRERRRRRAVCRSEGWSRRGLNAEWVSFLRSPVPLPLRCSLGLGVRPSLPLSIPPPRDGGLLSLLLGNLLGAGDGLRERLGDIVKRDRERRLRLLLLVTGERLECLLELFGGRLPAGDRLELSCRRLRRLLRERDLDLEDLLRFP